MFPWGQETTIEPTMWGDSDLNRGLADYESAALTN